MERNVTPSSFVRNGIRIRHLMLAIGGIAAVVTGCSTRPADPGTTTPVEAGALSNPFLAVVSGQIALPARIWTASGTHTAKGYATKAAEATSVEGMKADCANINLNKKLAADFRSDVFGGGMKGFFYKCQQVGPDTNEYWFTVSAANQAQIDKLCDPTTKYPIVYDEQHDTYWIDEPFTCTSRVSPS
jgi:hypothetical protein